MKKITILSIAVLTIGLVSGCGGKDTPFTVEADSPTSDFGDTTVNPADSKTDIQGTTGSGDDAISDYVASTPETPLMPEPAGVVDDSPEIETPPSTGSGATADVGTPTIEAPFSGNLYERLPADVTARLGGMVLTILPSLHDQDVVHLMNDTFQPDKFTPYEQQVQTRIMAERAAVAEELSVELKNYVVAVLRALIHAQHNDANVFKTRTSKLAQIIAAFKSGDSLRVGNAVYNGELSSHDLLAAAFNHQDQLKQAGSYLEIQFAEALKDIAKASFQANAEVHWSSTLVAGGDAFALVYAPTGFMGLNFNNHISGLADATIWHMGTSDWQTVAEGIRGALNAELHPVDAAADARAIESMGRQMQEQGERIMGAMGRW